MQRRALELFEALLDVDAATRSAELAALAIQDPALHAQVTALLAADAGDGPLERELVLEIDSPEAADPDPDDAMPGRRIGPWRIVEIIGRGGMGAVYRGERAAGEFEQQAAIKLIRLGLDQPELRLRFVRERQILARLQHPNIASLLDGGVTENGAPYFAMELVDGVPIDRWSDARRLDLRARIGLFMQVCSAVHYAHQNLVVHRDLKPGNILVTAQGQAKLLDFGIAKLLETDAAETRTHGHVLTPEYAAPEQLRGTPITTATDLYALGVVLYGLLTGGHPFVASARSAFFSRSLAASDREPEPITRVAARSRPDKAHARRLATPQALSAALRGDLAAIVHRCLQVEPAHRYGSVEALGQDLQAWLDGRPVGARIGQRGYRVRKFVSRHRWGVAGSLAGLLAIGVALGVALLQAREAKRQAAEATRTRDFVVGLFEAANPMKSTQGTDLSAVQLLQGAAARVDAELVDSPKTQADLRISLGHSLRELGEVEAAARLLETGVAQMRRQRRAPETLAQGLQKLAMARTDRGDLDAAQDALREAIALLDSATGDHRLEQIQMRTTLAKLLGLRGRQREALQQHQRIQRDRGALIGADHPDTAVDWNNLGNAYLQLDRCSEAEQAFERARVLLARGLGAEHPRSIWVLVGRGASRDCAGHYVQAQEDFVQTERILRSTLTMKHPIALSLLGVRGRSQERQGNPQAASVQYLQALALANELDDARTARIEGRLGIVLLQLGRPAEAERHLAAALASLAEDRRAAGDPISARFRAAYGLALYRNGQRGRGERELRAALASLERSGESRREGYAESAGDLAALLQSRGATNEALAWRRRAQSAYAQTFGAEHPLSLRAGKALAPPARAEETDRTPP